MKRVAHASLLALAVGGLLAVSGAARTVEPGAPAPAAFRLADGSAGCTFDGARLACRSASVPRAVVLEADGRSYADDVDVTWDASTTVLRPTESWWHGDFSCRLAGTDVVCSAGSGLIAVGAGGVGGGSATTATIP